MPVDAPASSLSVLDFQRRIDELSSKLRESESRHALVSDAVAEGIYEWSIEANSLWVSSRLIEMFGFEGRELKAADWNELIHPDDFAGYRNALRGCLKGATKRLDCEYRVRHSDGAYRWIEDRAVGVRNGAGRAVRLVGAVTDVTARKEGEQALREALEQQTATAEVLSVINSSPGNLFPVFDAMLEKAMRLCDAAIGGLGTWQEKRFSFAALRGPQPLLDYVASHEVSLGSREGFSRVARGEGFVQYTDISKSELYESGEPYTRALVDLCEGRTTLSVPLVKDDVVLGILAFFRQEVKPFSDKQIALVRNFAGQAVVAMENARLLSELHESLERQTSSADILRVISESPTNVQPVFDVIADSALRLLNGWSIVLWRYDGDRLRIGAIRGGNPGSNEAVRGRLGSIPLEELAFLRDAIRERACKQIIDVENEDIPQTIRDIARERGWRANIAVPMLSEGQLIGLFSLSRVEPGTFSESEIRLLQTFADQAVIAIQNVRLFTEQRELLEQQTATADILRVISQSPNDVQPVLNVVARAALRFCGANDVVIGLRDGEELVIAAHEGPIGERTDRRKLDRSSTQGRAVLDRQTIHVPNTDQLDLVEWAPVVALARTYGHKSLLTAPMLREGEPIGTIMLRRIESGPFTPRQIQLLESFAAQAVIAIENVRLFTELRNALEQQTATADILRVISQSPTDVEPVLDAVASAARRYCGASDALVTLREGGNMRVATHDGSMRTRVGEISPLDRTRVSGRCILQSQTIHVPDVSQLDPAEFATTLELARTAGFRAILAAPMLRDGTATGSILLRKSDAGAFTSRQVELLETFAAQAVIAIENVRLFTELRESLERLKAAQANLIQSEKMASLGQLTAGIAHEIKNPLNFVNNFAGLSVELVEELKRGVESMLAEPDDDKRAELQDTMDLLTSNLAKIAEHGRRADGIVKSMLSHSRGGTGDWQPSNINSLVEEALNLAYHGARAQDKDFNVTLERDFTAEPMSIEVVPQDVTRVFLNLFGNGFYATRKRHLEGGDAGYRPTLRVSTHDLGEAVEVRVRDNGTGIQPEVRAKLFQPFFTTKPTGEGTGLGLSISYDIITQQHGGSIDVESEPGAFTEFTVRLPRRRRAA